jgi:hypothetical protein
MHHASSATHAHHPARIGAIVAAVLLVALAAVLATPRTAAADSLPPTADIASAIDVVATATVGAQLQANVTIANHSTGGETLPSFQAFVSSPSNATGLVTTPGAGVSCVQQTANEQSCTIPALTPGATASVALVFTVPAAGDYSVSVVTCGAVDHPSDPTPADNDAVAHIAVTAAAGTDPRPPQPVPTITLTDPLVPRAGVVHFRVGCPTGVVGGCALRMYLMSRGRFRFGVGPVARFRRVINAHCPIAHVAGGASRTVSCTLPRDARRAFARRTLAFRLTVVSDDTTGRSDTQRRNVHVRIA